MTRILIADDHTIVRRGLKQILSEESDLEVTAESSTGQQTLERVADECFDVVVLDISMPGRSGLDTLIDLKRDHPDLPVLVLSMHPEEQYAVRALKFGASGYLTKESAANKLVEAIRTVAMGHKYITSEIAERLTMELGHDRERPIHEVLSNREFEVMRELSSGKTVKQIADQLCLSVKTISTYRTRVLEKLNMSTTAELTHYALKEGLVQ
jgi:two-component system invasion response regulator UvrY